MKNTSSVKIILKIHSIDFLVNENEYYNKNQSTQAKHTQKVKVHVHIIKLTKIPFKIYTVNIKLTTLPSINLIVIYFLNITLN